MKAESRRAMRARATVSRGDMREGEILDRAATLLREGAFDGTSIEAIAHSVGITRPTFYFYFGSKEALLVGVTLRVLEDLNDRLAVSPDRLAAGAPPREIVRGVIADVMETWRGHPAELCAVVEISGRSDGVLERWVEVVERSIPILVDVAMRSGTHPALATREGATEVIRALTWMTEHSLYLLARRGFDPVEADELLEVLTTVSAAAIGV